MANGNLFDNLDIRAIGDRLEPSLREKFNEAVEAAAKVVHVGRLLEIIETADYAALDDLALIMVTEGLIPSTAEFVVVMQEIIELVGSAVAATLGVSFTIDNAAVVAWIRQHVGSLIVGISEDALVSVRTLAERAYVEGVGTRAFARQLRPAIGLLPRHAETLRRYVLQLVEADVPQQRVAELAELYERRLINWRANMIARTETMAATHAGQLEAWRQAAEQGLFDITEAKIRWVVTEDDRLCPLCAPLDGVEVPFGQQFVATVKGFPHGKPTVESPGSARLAGTLRPDPYSQPRDLRGRFKKRRKMKPVDDRSVVSLTKPIFVSHPPLHPQCRCTLQLDIG